MALSLFLLIALEAWPGETIDLGMFSWGRGGRGTGFRVKGC